MKISTVIPFIQHYPWGNSYSIPQILGKKPDGSPWAELWLGTHPKGPAKINFENETILLRDYIQKSPIEILGRAAHQVNAELPFMLKILAVEKPLSIQCHPTKLQAEKGFSQENIDGIDKNAFNRSYQDDNHKPELVCALTHFIALCGFRPEGEIDRLFDFLDSKVYKNQLYHHLFNEFLKESDRLREFFSALLQLPPDRKQSFLKDLSKAAAKYSSSIPEFQLVKKLLNEYPGDVSAAAPLYLNLIELQPGEALFQPAGELHAYIHGTGVELMANSDNVLRGGLTNKYIDIDELLKIVEFKGTQKEKIMPVKTSEMLRFEESVSGRELYSTPAREFQLSRIVPLSNITIDQRENIEILLCTSGTGTLIFKDTQKREQTLAVQMGSILLIPAVLPEYTITTAKDGMVFIAGIPGEAQ
ncbi:MAG: mannose-6-phosphate isomerase, class I [Spirochaetia bacterium]|nr:mannose-6-phosphate isomerase, class I [Bacteroidota bacterium]MBL7005788.1 mannose-6-phosphate isomerase, class I [Spirochaetia bacterium]